MPLGNIECPNCGSTFEYDTEKALAKCPHCGAQFVVRNVKMDTTVVNNYYSDSSNKESATNNNISEYRNLFDKLIVYSNNKDTNLIDKVGNELYENYPNSYMYQIYREYVQQNRFSMLLSPKQFDEFLNVYKEIVISGLNRYPLMWNELKKDNCLLVDNDDFVQTIEKGTKLEHQAAILELKSIALNDLTSNASRCLLGLTKYINFVNKIESEIENNDVLKFDFEKKHFDNLKRNRTLAKQN